MDFVLLGHHAGWLGSSWFLLVVAIFLVANALLLFVACLFLFLGFNFGDFVHFGLVLRFCGCRLFLDFFSVFCYCFLFIF